MKKWIYSGTREEQPSERELMHGKLARKAASEGIVLLKNEGILPLKKDTAVALLGYGAEKTVKGGIGSGDVNNRKNISIYQGLKEAGVKIVSEDWISDYHNRYEQAREAWKEKVLEEAKKDKDIVVVCTDSRGSAKLGAYPDEVPEQFVEMGIAEQNSVTVSAGMAYMGKKVFTIGPASFYSMRSAEQVKVDVAYSHNNVTVIGISGGISYGALGATHHSLQDISLMRAIPGLTVMIPSDAVQMRKITKELLESPRPTYIRIARSGVPVIYDENTEFKIGKAKRLTDGKDAAIIVCGQLVATALQAAEELKEEGINVSVVDMFTIKPLDTEMIETVAKECGCILTLEEHSIYGGLGGAVAEVAAQTEMVPLDICGIPDEDVPNGTDQEVFKYYKMDVQGIKDRVKILISKKSK